MSPRKIPTWPQMIGYTAMTIGIVPLLLWVANYVDLIRPEEKPGFGLELFVSAGMIGIGWMVATENGTKVWEAFVSWFPSRSSGPRQ